MAALVEKGVDTTGKNLSNVGDLIRSIGGGTEPIIIDGLEYRTAKMPDGRIWMCENLQVNVENSWFYNNDEATYGRNGLNYGRLYLWDAAMGISVPGWHLPTKDEWDALADAVGGESVAGTKLKANSGWGSGNGTDDFGFSVFPAGCRASGSFNLLGRFALFWTASEYSSSDAYGRSFNTGASMSSGIVDKTSYAYSVRLVKDA